MSSRTITIDLVNRVPDTTLGFGSPSASSGGLPSAQPAAVATGETMAVYAANPSGGCTGGFALTGGDAAVKVAYDHPYGAGATTVAVTPSTGYLAGADAQTFPGHDSLAHLNLYRGVPAAGGYAVPLGLLADPAFDNCQDFVNSLFAPGMRNAEAITGAYANPAPDGYVIPADFTGGQMAGFVARWTRFWLTGDPSGCPAADTALIALLARYMQSASNAGPLSLWLPQIEYQAGSSPSVFLLSGYREFPFMAGGSWNPPAVQTFLTLLAAGGHFVAVSAEKDLPGQGVGMQSFDTFFTGSGLPTRHDPGNSHYATVVNGTGTYYLSVDSDFAPAGCSLLLAFLVGRTVNVGSPAPGTYNTFIQLEGWQSGTSRHNADFDTYKQTLWNISTFGASPYSEKRATTAFLAPPGFTPQVYQITRMMPYVGAYARSDGTPQPWLNTKLVDIPPDAPPLPARYYG